MAPTGLAVDARAYAQVIGRLADLLALASVLPVILSGRFSRRARPLQEVVAKRPSAPDRPQGQQDQDDPVQEESEPSAQPGKTQGDWPDMVLGLPSVLLLIASEALRCRDVFTAGVAPKASERKMPDLKGPLKAALQAISKALKLVTSSKSGGAMEHTAQGVVQVLDSQEVFDAVHGIVMIVALGVAAATVASSAVLPALGRLADRRAWRALLQGMAVAAPLLMFAACRWEALGKAGRALAANEGLFGALPLLLRLAGLLAAARPVPCEAPTQSRGSLPQSEGGTPALFAALQAASLVTRLSQDVASGGLAKALGPLVHNPRMEAVLDSGLLVVHAPLLIVIVWLCLVHLNRKPGTLMLVMLLSIATSPVVIAKGWPLAAFRLRLGKKNAEAQLVKFVSLAYAGTAISSFLVGGSLTLLAVLAMGQLLTWIHGTNAFAAQFV